MNEETVKHIMNGAGDLAKLTSGAATTLTTEAINWFIFKSILGVLQAAVVFILFAIVHKGLSTLCDISDEKGKKTYKTCSRAALMVAITYFAAVSLPHLETISKAMVAPNLFLAEKTIELIDKKKE